jgi:hypothetical protein
MKSVTATRKCPTGLPECGQGSENALGGVQTYPEPEIALCGLPRGSQGHVAFRSQFYNPDRVRAALNGRSSAVLREIVQVPVIPSRGSGQ